MAPLSFRFIQLRLHCTDMEMQLIFFSKQHAVNMTTIMYTFLPLCCFCHCQFDLTEFALLLYRIGIIIRCKLIRIIFIWNLVYNRVIIHETQQKILMTRELSKLQVQIRHLIHSH